MNMRLLLVLTGRPDITESSRLKTEIPPENQELVSSFYRWPVVKRKAKSMIDDTSLPHVVWPIPYVNFTNAAIHWWNNLPPLFQSFSINQFKCQYSNHLLSKFLSHCILGLVYRFVIIYYWIDLYVSYVTIYVCCPLIYRIYLFIVYSF